MPLTVTTGECDYFYAKPYPIALDITMHISLYSYLLSRSATKPSRSAAGPPTLPGKTA